MTLIEEFEHLKDVLRCAFCLNSLQNRDMHEAPTGKKVVSDVPSNDGKEAVGFVCVDCKGKEPKFVVNTKGDEIDTERLENIPKVHTINVSEGVTISETVTATKEEE